MFKRRKPRSYSQMASDMVYPRGGWRRAGTYVLYRLRRLPDQPHRVSRGIAAGVFVSFTPAFGLHFALAASFAWLIGGNLLAALLATFVGNPLTFPFIAVLGVSLGREILGLSGQLSPQLIFGEFARASTELWRNIHAIFGPGHVRWDNLVEFIHDVYWPYCVGGTIIGLSASIASHYLTLPVIRAYHLRREKKMAARIARVRKLQQERAALVPDSTITPPHPASDLPSTSPDEPGGKSRVSTPSRDPQDTGAVPRA